MKRACILMFVLGLALISGAAVGTESGKDLGVTSAPGRVLAGRMMSIGADEGVPFRVVETAAGGRSGMSAPPQERGITPKGAFVPAILGTSDWYGWLNQMPPGPFSVHITGIVTVPSPGHDARLVRSAPQGVNPLDLKLDLQVTRRPGTWPSRAMKLSVRYDEMPASLSYNTASIQWPGGTPVFVQVERVY
jgi:hypothetical protein